MIYKEDENGHIHTFPTYFDEKVEKEKYYEVMGLKQQAWGRVGPQAAGCGQPVDNLWITCG